MASFFILPPDREIVVHQRKGILLGVTSRGRMTEKAPVRTEPHLPGASPYLRRVCHASITPTRRHADTPTRPSPPVDNSSAGWLLAALESPSADWASKYFGFNANYIDPNGGWRLKVGRYGVKWFTCPWFLYGIAPGCAADICRRIPARDGREKSRYHPVSVAAWRGRRVLCDPEFERRIYDGHTTRGIHASG
jgi:hypothetical protein